MPPQPDSEISPNHPERQADGDRSAHPLDQFRGRDRLAQQAANQHIQQCSTGRKHRDNPAQRKNVQDTQTQSRAHLGRVGQGFLHDPPGVHPERRPNQQQSNTVGCGLTAQFTERIRRNIEKETQQLLRPEDHHQQSVEHPQIAVKPPDIGEILAVRQPEPLAPQDRPEISRDHAIHQNRDGIIRQVLIPAQHGPICIQAQSHKQAAIQGCQ